MAAAVGLLACIPGLGTVVGAVCCCVSGVGCAINLCGCMLKCKNSSNARFLYALLLLLVTVTAWALKNWGDQIISTELQTCAGECFQYLAVYRMSLGLVFFHVLMWACTLFVEKSTDMMGRLHNGVWPLKIIIVGLLLVACFYIPVEAYHVYGYIAIVLGVLFLIIQTIVILDFAYNWAESWVEKYEQNEDVFWRCCLIFVAVFCYCGTLAGTVVLYVYFATNAGCGLNVFFITFNVILCIVMTIGAIHPKVQEANPKSGLMQAGIISIYSTYIVAMAIASEPNDPSFNCASSSTTNDSMANVLFYLGFACSFLAISISAWSTGGSDQSLMLKSPSSSIVDEEDMDDEKDGVTYRYWLFHLVFIGAAGYMAALLNNWTIVYDIGDGSGSSSESSFTIDRGFGSVWVKMCTSWVICLLYIWTLIAPVLMPDRFN